jgi:hypothetical protein
LAAAKEAAMAGWSTTTGILGLVLAAALAGCGGGGDGEAVAAAPSEESGAGGPSGGASAPTGGAGAPGGAASGPTGGADAPGGVAGAPSDGVAIDHAAFGGALPDAEADAAAARVASFVDARLAGRAGLAAMTAEEIAADLVAALRTQPDAAYVRTSASDFTVTVQLRDGSPIVVPTRFAADGSPRRLTRGADARPAATSSAPAFRSAALATPAPTRVSPLAERPRRTVLATAAQPGDPVLPAGRRATFLTFFAGDAGHEGAQRDVKALFDAVGYAATTGTLSMDALVAASGSDVLWLDTHGVDFAVAPSPQAAPVTVYALVVKEAACTDAPCRARFRPMLSNGQAVRGSQGRWLVTPAFVRANLRFPSDRSVVVLDACESANPNATPTAMRAAFRAQNAGHVYGWVRQVYPASGQRVVREFFDAALGTNRHFAAPWKQRPYQLTDVWVDLESKGRTKDDHPGDAVNPPGDALFELSPLTPPPLASSGLVLRPSIGSWFVQEGDAVSRLTMTGLYGDADGTVTVNGQALANVAWRPWGLEADIPNQGSGIAGPIVVTSNGIASAPVPLTLWEGSVQQDLKLVSEWGPPGIDFTSTCRVAFRGSIAETRVNLQMEPVLDSLGFVVLMPIRDASLNACTWSVSGEGRQNDRTTLVGPAAAAVRTQAPPAFTPLALSARGPGPAAARAALGTAMEVRYRTFDKDGKLLLEGDRTYGFDGSALNADGGLTLSSGWAFSGSFAGPTGSDLRDRLRVSLDVRPRFLPSAETVR